MLSSIDRGESLGSTRFDSVLAWQMHQCCTNEIASCLSLRFRHLEAIWYKSVTPPSVVSEKNRNVAHKMTSHFYYEESISSLWMKYLPNDRFLALNLVVWSSIFHYSSCTDMADTHPSDQCFSATPTFPWRPQYITKSNDLWWTHLYDSMVPVTPRPRNRLFASE